MNCEVNLKIGEPVECGKAVNVIKTVTVYPSWWSPIDKIRGLGESVVLKHRKEVADNLFGRGFTFIRK